MRTAAVLVAVGSLMSSASLTLGSVFNMPSGQKSLEFVTVGDPGNVADTLVMVDGTTGYGAVSATYQMGKYEVTAGQYCQFLNAVAATDAYGLYHTSMAGVNTNSCGIARDGTAGSYTYRLTRNPDYPVNWVSWGDAARFCNWLANGQGGPGTTETGSYTLNGATIATSWTTITRNPGATYVIPNVNEWYKAAYYKAGGTSAGYWMYPTQSDTVPSNTLSSTGTNNANFWTGSYTDPANLLTAAGTFVGSPGPYGTFDQGGNALEWNETPSFSGMYRGLRGGPFYRDHDTYGYTMRASFNGHTYAGDEHSGTGFRIALIPEPATLSLLALGGLLIARRRRAGAI